MARSAKQAKRRPPPRRGLVAIGLGALGGWVSRNPVATGISTALLLATAYVGANALWYQPHAHRGALFATRDFARQTSHETQEPEPETTFLIERPAAPVAAPAADPTIERIQRILADLNFYEGKIDGLPGPATSRAIARYRGKVGLSATAAIDGDLLIQLGIQPTTSAIAPSPAPRTTSSVPAKPGDKVDLVRKIQAGLKRFGKADVDVDGIAGQKTKNGVRDFQTAFGLKPTGEVDETVYARMKEVGFAD